MSYLSSVHRGAGFDLNNKESGLVKIINLDNSKSLGTFKFKNGEFYKVLANGNYEFVIKTSTISKKVTASVREKNIVTNGNYVRL